MGWSIAQDTHYLCISFLLNVSEEELFSSYYYVFIQTLFQYNETRKVPFSPSTQGQQSRKHVSLPFSTALLEPGGQGLPYIHPGTQDQLTW